MIDLAGVRIFGVNMRETDLLTIRNTMNKIFKEMRYAPFEREEDYEKTEAYYLMGKLSNNIILMTELVAKDESLWSDNLDALKKLLDDSRLGENGEFLTKFAKKISSSQRIVSLLNEFAGVTVEKGSLIVRFRDPILRQVQRLKIDAKALLTRVEAQKEAIANSFRQLGEWAWQSGLRPILHAGIYIAALVLVIISVWFSITHGVATSLQVTGENLLASLKSALPLILSIVWLACTIFVLATSVSRLQPIRDYIEDQLGK